MKTLTSIDDVCDLESNWYALQLPLSLDKPSCRVGHSLLYNSQENSVLCIGGANPDGPSTTLHSLKLKSMKWNNMPSVGFLPRYEHSAFASNGNEFCVFVFGGADTSGNRNDMQMWKARDDHWESIKTKGCAPSPRTQHNCAITEDLIYVFAGGDLGTDPVTDRSVHCFDTKAMVWRQIAVSGSPPSHRQGHAMAAIKNKVYVHGGMCGTKLFDDLYVLDLKINQWDRLLPSGCKPSPRAAHSCVSVDKSLYLFGGLGKDGALNDLYRFDSETECWQLICFQNQVPSARLDFAMCTVTFNHLAAGVQRSEVDESSVLENQEDTVSSPKSSNLQKAKTIIFIHGGMDTLGNVYDDCYLYVL